MTILNKEPVEFALINQFVVDQMPAHRDQFHIPSGERPIAIGEYD